MAVYDGRNQTKQINIQTLRQNNTQAPGQKVSSFSTFHVRLHTNIRDKTQRFR